MQIKPGTFCPLIGGECKQFECMFWTQLRGTHPQSGQEIDEWDCAIKWLPVLLIEGSKETRQTAAAIESFRNEMVRGQQTVLRLAANGDPLRQGVSAARVKEIANARDDHRG